MFRVRDEQGFRRRRRAARGVLRGASRCGRQRVSSGGHRRALDRVLQRRRPRVVRSAPGRRGGRRRRRRRGDGGVGSDGGVVGGDGGGGVRRGERGGVRDELHHAARGGMPSQERALQRAFRLFRGNGFLFLFFRTDRRASLRRASLRRTHRLPRVGSRARRTGVSHDLRRVDARRDDAAGRRRVSRVWGGGRCRPHSRPHSKTHSRPHSKTHSRPRARRRRGGRGDSRWLAFRNDARLASFARRRRRAGARPPRRKLRREKRRGGFGASARRRALRRRRARQPRGGGVHAGARPLEVPPVDRDERAGALRRAPRLVPAIFPRGPAVRVPARVAPRRRQPRERREWRQREARANPGVRGGVRVFVPEVARRGSDERGARRRGGGRGDGEAVGQNRAQRHLRRAERHVRRR